MNKGVKVKLLPNNKQKTLFIKSAGMSRFAYNWALNKEIENYKNGNKFISNYDLRKAFTQLKKNEVNKWMWEISCDVPKQAIKDLEKSYKNFFNRIKKGKKSQETGFPKFKSKKNKQSFYIDNVKFKIDTNKIYVPTIGWVKTCEDLIKYSKEKLVNIRVSSDKINWFISFGVEVENSKEIVTSEVIGIDLGINKLATCSNGVVYNNINKNSKLLKLEKRKKRVQKRIAHKYNCQKDKKFKKTNNIKKLQKKQQILQIKVNNIKKDYIHKMTTEIINRKPRKIILEDLNVKGMLKNHKLAKSIQNVSFYEIKRQIFYKGEKIGIDILLADRFFPSSKLCSNCGNILTDLTLNDRIYECPKCNLNIDRDFNASINLMNYAPEVIREFKPMELKTSEINNLVLQALSDSSFDYEVGTKHKSL